MKVIIAEKPSLGRTIASALGHPSKQNGFLKVNDDLIVTYAYGHLLTLLDFDDYFGENVKWGDKLPYYPDPFKFQLIKKEGVKEQFNVIAKLINDSNTDEIICAGDADREGEVIVRLILMFALKDKSKKITRLWLPDQTPETIRKQMNERKLDVEYNNLYNEGISRMYIDWLLGINLTRSISSKANSLLNIGRVICPIVMEIYDRDMQIKDFIPERYYGIESKVNGINLISKQKYSIDELNQSDIVCHDFNSHKAFVKDITKKEVTKQPPKLFSLSKLQGYCGKKFKFKPKQTLELVQKLYEAGYVTYPRTNTEYLSENEKDKVKELISIYTTDDLPLAFKDTKRIFDDSKIESHSALMPTNKKTNLESLSENEQRVYTTIFNRFLSNFCAEECVIEETKAVISVGNEYQEDISIKGVRLQKGGWPMIEKDISMVKVLPPLEKNQQVKVDFKSVEKETNPPKKYTVETLGNWMTNPFRKETDTEDEEYKALLSGCEIGTEATRAGIIDKAISVGYISLKNNAYSIEDKGIYMVELLKKVNLDMSPQRTVELQKALKQVYKNEKSIKQVVDESKHFLDNYFNSGAVQDTEMFSKGTTEPEKVGDCPWCGQPVYKYKSKYGVYYSHNKEVGEKCSFSLNEKQKVYGKELNFTEARVQKLLNHKLPEFEFISKKTGKPYKAGLDITDKPNQFNGKNYPEFKIVFKK